MEFPSSYNESQYVAWHEKNIKADTNLRESISQLRAELHSSCEARLDELFKLFKEIESVQKFSLDENDDTYGIDWPVISPRKNPENYDILFKSNASILEKMWRKNSNIHNDDYVKIENIKSRIGDLVRTSIVFSTLSHAQKFTQIAKNWARLAEEKSLRPAGLSDIRIAEEAKMENGYFAYHIDVVYDDLRIEVQVFSKLAETWRHLSHKMYELDRIGKGKKKGYNTVASRLISLGHLLHIAECEAEEIKAEISKH